ncbi:MAG TPA: OmpA family protein [Chthoniobacteraceae bacterium]|nr:OmpA family protein [Chthoniobacteraceae bacterium]
MKARCLNYTGCLLAYRGEVIELPQNAPLVCPECGKTVNAIQGQGGGVGKALVVLIVLGAVAAGIYFLAPKLKGFISRKPAPQEETGEPVPATPSHTGGEPTPRVAVATPGVPVTNPSSPSSPAKIDLDLKTEENKRVRNEVLEVLKRIDSMPKLSQENKDKLYNKVQAAKSMGLIMTIPFASGSSRLPATEVPALKAQFDQPDLAQIRSDYIYVFVVLGYADAKGDNAKNLQISQSRADSVAEAMRDKCGITNVIHAVAMGSSKLLDAQNLEKNRVVEIWAVHP